MLSTLAGVVFTMIGWCNLPEPLFEDAFVWLDSRVSPDVAYRARWADWCVRYSAYCAGLNGKWQMYGAQSRFNWRYVISARYADEARATEIVLPLPRQSERGWLEANVLDFKEAKFQLNIYNDELARETYARYLARRYPNHDGLPITHVRYTLLSRGIIPPIIAVREQQVLEPNESALEINCFAVDAENNSSSEFIVSSRPAE
jgi:hypothetical protein